MVNTQRLGQPNKLLVGLSQFVSIRAGDRCQLEGRDQWGWGPAGIHRVLREGRVEVCGQEQIGYLTRRQPKLFETGGNVGVRR